MIVIWSTSADTTADLVERRVRELTSDIIRVDTDRYGQPYAVSWRKSEGALRGDAGKRVLASQVRSVYYRRPTIGEVALSERDFALHEAWYFTRAVLLEAEQARWMNHPRALLLSENKLRQLRVASESGLTAPDGILTSCPEEAFAFYEHVDRHCVCKPGYAGLLHGPGEDLTVYAWRLPADLELTDFASVASSPTFLQREVEKVADIRLTYVGGESLAVRVLTDTEQSLDWRTQIGGDIAYEPIAVPQEVQHRIQLLMAKLSLSYGALDFCEAQDGEWLFLEVNPAGQFGWIEQEAGLSISGAIAQWLTAT